jgi:hypothetical protein
MIIELLKITIPALIVFGTVYYMLRQYFGNQVVNKQLEIQQSQSGQILPIKLQAYERLILFCDRISPQALIYRLNQKDMTVGGLKTALLIAIQQEYEHNMAQQIYVSDKLWEIISLAKSEVQNLVYKSAEGLEDDAPSHLLSKAMANIQGAVHFAPNEKAKQAIKEEVKLML